MIHKTLMDIFTEEIALRRVKAIITDMVTLFPRGVIQIIRRQIEALEVHAYVASAPPHSRLATMHQIHVLLSVPKAKDTQAQLEWCEEHIQVSVDSPLSFRKGFQLRPHSTGRTTEHQIIVKDDRLIGPWLSRTRSMIHKGYDIETWAGLPLIANENVVNACWEVGELRADKDRLNIDGSNDEYLVLRPGCNKYPLILKKSG